MIKTEQGLDFTSLSEARQLLSGDSAYDNLFSIYTCDMEFPS